MSHHDLAPFTDYAKSRATGTPADQLLRVGPGPGHTVEVRITAPGSMGRVLREARYTLAAHDARRLAAWLADWTAALTTHPYDDTGATP